MAGHATLFDDLHDLVIADDARARQSAMMTDDSQRPKAS